MGTTLHPASPFKRLTVTPKDDPDAPPTDFCTSLPVEMHISTERFEGAPGDGDPRGLPHLPPEICDELARAIPLQPMGQSPEGAALERRQLACRTALGRNIRTRPPSVIREFCEARCVGRGLYWFSARYGLTPELARKYIIAALAKPPSDEFFAEMEAEVRERGVPAWDDLGAALDQAHERELAEAAESAARVAESEARGNRDNEEEPASELCDAMLIIEAAVNDSAFAFMPDLNKPTLSPLIRNVLIRDLGQEWPRDSKGRTLVFIRNHGYTAWGPFDVEDGVTLAPADYVPPCTVRALRVKRAIVPELMSSIRRRMKKGISRPMTKAAEFADENFPKAKHNHERWLEWADALIGRAVSDSAVYLERALLLDRAIRGMRRKPHLVVDELYALGVEWWEREQPGRPTPAHWNVATLTKAANGVVSGTNAYSEPGEWEVEPSPGILDRLLRGWRGDELREPTLAALPKLTVRTDNGDEAVRTETIASFYRESGLIDGELGPAKHARIVAIMKSAGFEKKNVTLNGQRVKAFVRKAQPSAGEAAQ